jgi:hypothetical protein
VIIQDPVTRLVTGPVVNGDTMKINEFFNQDQMQELRIGDKLPYDVVEDLIVYMKNDPDFYRKHLYPVMVDVQETVKHGNKYNKKNLLPVVERAIESYLAKFEIKKRPGDLLMPEEKMDCINKLLKDEVDNFRKGFY